jgi:branched-chain amino acid transport system substrate-binding protein
VVLFVAVAACGGGGNGRTNPPKRTTAVVYSSLPMRGERRAQALALSNGVRLALQQSEGRAGTLRVRYRPLDDTARATGTVSAPAAARNARTAVRDDDAVAYLGEFDEGSAYSLPFTNEAGLAQVGSADSAVGLTTGEAGASPSEPVVYRASGKRTFVRIVPRDTIQAAALMSLATESGCTKPAIANDGTQFGTHLAESLQAAAGAQQLDVALNVTLDGRKTDYRSQAAKARLAGADCFVFAGLPSSVATTAYEDFGAALADAELFGPDRLADARFTDADAGGVSAAIARRVRLTVLALPPDYPKASAKFARDYEQAYGEKPLPSALYGYEAMHLVLDAIGHAGDNARADVVRALFETKDRESMLGAYSIDEYGDTTLASYGVGSIVDGRVDVNGTISGLPGK